MVRCARNARGRLYGEALTLKDFQSKDKKQEVLEKKLICERLKELSAKRKKIDCDTQWETKAINEEIRSLSCHKN
ncbi:hypothetical protein PR048_026772 [Dryococelus australis]|uniref:Uncharacterized protein n=1 Tax=Dryococelus australis TaxID=614101 RepID=A0ABQ9GMB8_9NEOP|nr:hypothetical protein PR048_026772 [Dryococelus australis]